MLFIHKDGVKCHFFVSHVSSILTAQLTRAHTQYAVSNPVRGVYLWCDRKYTPCTGVTVPGLWAVVLRWRGFPKNNCPTRTQRNLREGISPARTKPLYSPSSIYIPCMPRCIVIALICGSNDPHPLLLALAPPPKITMCIEICRTVRCIIVTYVNGSARALYPVHVERAQKNNNDRCFCSMIYVREHQ